MNMAEVAGGRRRDGQHPRRVFTVCLSRRYQGAVFPLSTGCRTNTQPRPLLSRGVRRLLTNVGCTRSSGSTRLCSQRRRPEAAGGGRCSPAVGILGAIPQASSKLLSFPLAATSGHVLASRVESARHEGAITMWSNHIVGQDACSVSV